MNAKLTGTVKDVQTKTGTSANGNAWKKTTVILQSDGQYPVEVACTIMNDKVFVPLPGEPVTYHVNIKSREYNGNWFTELQVWKAE
jgi:hypothetical protein